MSAVDGVQRVLRWAMSPSQGPPPRGDLRSPQQLLRPPDELGHLLAQLASTTAATLRLGNPPLGEDERVGLDGLVVAAALANRHLPLVTGALLGRLERRPNVWSLVARHALVAPALAHVPIDLAHDLLACSPLTALLDHPPPHQDTPAMGVATRWLRSPVGRVALQLHLARPSTRPAVLAWRARLFDRLRLSRDRRAFVLDVYEAALIHHEQEHMEMARRALGVFLDPRASRDDRLLNEALAIADWWGPLHALERIDLDALRARRYLGYAYREGIRIYNISRQMRGL